MRRSPVTPVSNLARKFLAWILTWIWQKEKPVAATITIQGVTFPVSDFEAIANIIIDGIKTGKQPEDVLKNLEPALLPIVETLAGSFIPYGGAIIALAVFIYSKSIPFKSLPQKEQNDWMDRFGINTQS